MQEPPVICDLNAIYAFRKQVSEELLNLLNQCIWSTYLPNFRIGFSSREQVLYYNNKVALINEKAKKNFVSTIKQNAVKLGMKREVNESLDRYVMVYIHT